MKTPVAVVAAVVLVALGYAAATWRQSLDTPAPAAPAPAADAPPADTVRFDVGAAQLTSIRVEPAMEAPVPLAEPLNARLAYNENATARVASPIAGRVTALRLQPGDAVKAGDPLLVIDAPELALAVADLHKARTDEQRKALALERAQKLTDAGVIPRKELESAVADHDAARAETQRAVRRLRNLAPGNASGALPDSAAYTLRAPIAGIIADRRVNPGTEVRPDLADPLFTITDPARLWVLIDLPERDLAKVKVGHRTVVQVDAFADQLFNATVERIGEVVDPNTRRVQVRAALDNPKRLLKPEMYARVTLVADDGARAVRVPNSAIVTQGLYSYVFVETAPGLFKRRRIELTVQDREYSYLSADLARDEKLVTTGALLLNSELSSAAR
jgi:cobalt-zinc-cadmium efflux system membrane fusion protein